MYQPTVPTYLILFFFFFYFNFNSKPNIIITKYIIFTCIGYPLEKIILISTRRLHPCYILYTWCSNTTDAFSLQRSFGIFPSSGALDAEFCEMAYALLCRPAPGRRSLTVSAAGCTLDTTLRPLAAAVYCVLAKLWSGHHLKSRDLSLTIIVLCSPVFDRTADLPEYPPSSNCVSTADLWTDEATVCQPGHNSIAVV